MPTIDEIATIKKVISETATIKKVISEIATLDFVPPVIDEAADFIAAAGITDQIQIDAINALVDQLKAASIWDLITVLYPIVGGNANAHSFNLRNSSTFQIVWVNDPTHSATGVDYDGVDQFGDTGFVVPSNSGHLGVYIRENVSDSNQDDLGATTDASSFNSLNSRRSILNAFLGAINSLRATLGISKVFDSNGFALLTKPTTGTLLSAYKNGLLIDSSNPVAGTISDDIWLGGTNNAGTLLRPSTRQAAYYTFGADLDAAKVLSYFDIIETFQASLSREVLTNEISLLHDGIDSRVDIPDDASLNFERTDPFSVSQWVKLNSLGSLQIFSSRRVIPVGWIIHTNPSNIIRFLFAGTGPTILQVQSNFAISDNDWHNYIITYDGSSNASGVKMYIDGVSDTLSILNDALSTSTLVSSQLKIGIDGNNTGPINGNTDETSVWKKELTSSQALEIYNGRKPTNLLNHTAASDLVGWWRYDKDTFPTVLDNSTNTNDGTVINGVSGDFVKDTPQPV